MTKEEQIFAYKELRNNGQAFFVDNYEDADRIIETLEKQIPKEPFRIGGIDSNDNAFVDCPICKAGNETSIKTIKQIYCWRCGQAIKWE